MKDQKVSIIIPIYNVEAYLEKCISSVRNQTYTDLEIILVDDGSTDGCAEICRIAAKEDARILVIHKENGGLSDARNAGIQMASGKYLMFVDSDDYIHEQMVERLYQELTKKDADLAMCEFYKEAPDGRHYFEATRRLKKAQDGQIFEGEEIERLIFEDIFENRSSLVVAWNKLYKAELFEEIRYPAGKLHEDEYVIHELLYKAKRMVYIDEPCYYYVQHKSSIMGTVSQKRIEDGFGAIEARADFFKEKGETELYKRTLRDYLNLAKKTYRKLSQQKGKENRGLKRQIRSKTRKKVLEMRQSYVIVGMRFYMEMGWTCFPGLFDTIVMRYYQYENEKRRSK